MNANAFAATCVVQNVSVAAAGVDIWYRIHTYYRTKLKLDKEVGGGVLL